MDIKYNEFGDDIVGSKNIPNADEINKVDCCILVDLSEPSIFGSDTKCTEDLNEEQFFKSSTIHVANMQNIAKAGPSVLNGKESSDVVPSYDFDDHIEKQFLEFKNDVPKYVIDNASKQELEKCLFDEESSYGKYEREEKEYQFQVLNTVISKDNNVEDMIKLESAVHVGNEFLKPSDIIQSIQRNCDKEEQFLEFTHDVPKHVIDNAGNQKIEKCLFDEESSCRRRNTEYVSVKKEHQFRQLNTVVSNDTNINDRVKLESPVLVGKEAPKPLDTIQSVQSDDDEDEQFWEYKNEIPTHVIQQGVKNIDAKNERMEKKLALTYQEVPTGIIINSEVYLTNKHWNTICSQNNYYFCVVCDEPCDEGYEKHIGCETHKKNLDSFPPLEHYGLSIVRKIRNSLHCGVCAMIFVASDTWEHFDSTSHRDNVLYSSNKASDVMYDVDIHREMNSDSDCYKYDRNFLLNSNTNGDEDKNYCDYNDFDDTNYYYYGYDGPNADGSHQSEDFDDEDAESEVIQAPSASGVSYASIAKRETPAPPAYVEKRIRGVDFKISYESYHTLLKTERSKYYCAACNSVGQFRYKTEHTYQEVHLRKLEEMPIKHIENYFVRKVNDKYYHCGHCNTLQLDVNLKSHLSEIHPRKVRNHSESSSHSSHISTPAINASAKAKFKPNKKNTKKFTPRNHNPSENTNTTKVITFENMYKDMVFDPFDRPMKIPFVFYNAVMMDADRFVCHLCDYRCKGADIIPHLYDFRHVELLQTTEFIEQFGSNLIRVMRLNIYHCAICNIIIINYNNLMSHTLTVEHQNLHRKATTVPREATTLLGNTTRAKEKKNVKGKEKKVNEVNENKKKIKLDTRVSVSVSEQRTVVSDSVAENIELTKREETVDTRAAASVLEQRTVVSDLVVENVEHTKREENSKQKETTNNSPSKSREMEVDDDDENDDNEVTKDQSITEEYIYIKHMNKYFKITLCSYNTLVCIGDGSRYCYVCSITVESHLVRRHIESRTHTENVIKTNFIDKYLDHLLRQFFLTYHCGVCNVPVSRRDLKTHLTWPVHCSRSDEVKAYTKKERKMDIRSGVREASVNVQRENIFLKENEGKPKVRLNVSCNVEEETRKLVKKNQPIILDDNILMISWENWNGIYEDRDGTNCRLCCTCVENLPSHVLSTEHVNNLNKPVRAISATLLLRKINQHVLNCLICNAEVSNSETCVKTHAQGKKHIKNYETVQSTSKCDYSDCSEQFINVPIVQHLDFE